MAKGLPRSLSRGTGKRSDLRKLDIPIRDLIVNVAAAGAGVGFGTVVLAGLAEGHILFQGAMAQLRFSGPAGGSADLVDTWSGDFAVGTAPDADGALAGAEVDLIPSTAVGPAVAEVSPVTTGVSTATESGVMFDNTAGALEINLNVLVDAADITDASNVDLTVDGAIQIAYIVLGDD